MKEKINLPPESIRVPTGIDGLDSILGGGLFGSGIYIVAGRPGAGKTILANQACFHHVASGGRALYVTLLAETHARMIAQLRSLDFFDADAVGSGLQYLNGFSALEDEGLEGLLRLLRSAVRTQKADFLVLDGIFVANGLAPSSVSFKKFINELQTWVGMIGCTVLFLTSTTPEELGLPAHTMVDGILALESRTQGMRRIRYCSVTKFRGSAFTEGLHSYSIRASGITIYPRYEAHGEVAFARPLDERRPFEVERIDEIFHGGVHVGTTTLVLGGSGGGKTSLGLHFLAGGRAHDEPGLFFGFHESDAELRAKGERLGLPIGELIEAGKLTVAWHPFAENDLDRLALELLALVRARKVKRLVLDDLTALIEVGNAERLPGYLSKLDHELRALGVTSLILSESGELIAQPGQPQRFEFASSFSNVVLMRRLALEGEFVHLLSVVKTRGSAHEPGAFRFTIERGRGLVVGGRLDAPSRAAPTQQIPSRGRG